MTATTADRSDIRIVPMGSGPGARVEGCDRAGAWDDETAATVRQTWLEYEVLVFPGDKMDAEGVLAFARRFGDPIPSVNRDRRHGELPEVTIIVSTITASDPEKGPEFALPSVRRAEGWHTDQSFLDLPAMASILHAHEVPSRGGATWFCDTRAAYDALDDDFKARLDGLRVVHVRTHPESGRKGLYLNFNRMNRIVGMDPAESNALLDELQDWVNQDRFIYCHNWSVGDAVVWDNRCTMHRVQYDSPPGDRRVMLRVCTQGDRPF